jgi:hypothetical protein
MRRLPSGQSEVALRGGKFKTATFVPQDFLHRRMVTGRTTESGAGILPPAARAPPV